MAVSSIGSHGQHSRYEAPAKPPPKPAQQPHKSAPPKKHTEHKVDIKA